MVMLCNLSLLRDGFLLKFELHGNRIAAADHNTNVLTRDTPILSRKYGRESCRASRFRNHPQRLP